MKKYELFGLAIIFLIYIGAYLMVITSMERKESLRPLYKAVSSQQTNAPIYLVNPSETARGASFFYLGRKIPVLNDQDVLSGRFDDRPGTILLVDSYTSDNQLFPTLQSKGYHLLLQKKYGKTAGVYAYWNSP